MKELVNHKTYFVTESGKLFRIKKDKKYEIKGSINYYGYLEICFWVNKKGCSKKIHRLIAEAFIPNPENKKTVNHKDGNKLNNSAKNLEWATIGENVRHARKLGLYPDRKGEDHPNSKLTNKDVIEIRRLCKEKKYNQVQIAKKYNLTPRNVCSIKKRETWRHI